MTSLLYSNITNQKKDFFLKLFAQLFFSCSFVKKSFIRHCRVRNGVCPLDDYGLLECKKSLIHIKGTVLENPCRCGSDDPYCRYYMQQFPTRNRCVGKRNSFVWHCFRKRFKCCRNTLTTVLFSLTYHFLFMLYFFLKSL